MRNKAFCLLLLVLLIAGCATNKPVPAEPPAPPEEEPAVYRPGYTVLAHDRPGLVGKIAAAPGHVLTTNSDQDYAQVQETLDEKERLEQYREKAKKEAEAKKLQAKLQKAPVVLPKRYANETPKPSKKVAKVDPWKRAWKRYCDNGNGLTDADHKILEKARYVIPDEFKDDCLPPK